MASTERTELLDEKGSNWMSLQLYLDARMNTIIGKLTRKVSERFAIVTV